MSEKKLYALKCDIMKHKGTDCSNGGISSKYNDVLVLCDEGYIEVNGDEPNLCKVVKRELWGEIYYHIEPIAKPNGVGWMSGGTVIYSCDSRFREMANGYPLSLHDRTESQELYDKLSR